jgi:hypothetical protein
MSRKLYKSRTDYVKCVSVQDEDEALKKGYRDIAEILAEERRPKPKPHPAPDTVLRRGALPAGRKLYKTKKDYVRIPDGDKEAEAEARQRKIMSVSLMVTKRLRRKPVNGAIKTSRRYLVLIGLLLLPRFLSL